MCPPTCVRDMRQEATEAVARGAKFLATTGVPVDSIEMREAEIRDRLILYLSSLTLDKTKGIRAKQQIRGNIVHRANAILERGKITRVFISEFITQ